MIQGLIQSLAFTPDPIIIEELPPPQVYILYDALRYLEMFSRVNDGLPYKPTNPEPYEIPKEIEERLDRSIEVLPEDVFLKSIRPFIRLKEDGFPPIYKIAERLPQTRLKLLDLLATALEPPSHIHLFPKNPGSEALDYNPQKSDRHDAPGREISRRDIGKAAHISKGGIALKDLKNLPTVAQIKYYALVRKGTVIEFIDEHAPSNSYKRVYKFMAGNINSKHSKRGKRVYDYGFAWIAKELGISVRTVGTIVKWLNRAKLLGRAWPADPAIDFKTGVQDKEKAHNSGWYVCTSMAQNLFLWTHPELFREGLPLPTIFTDNSKE